MTTATPSSAPTTWRSIKEPVSASSPSPFSFLSLTFSNPSSSSTSPSPSPLSDSPVLRSLPSTSPSPPPRSSHSHALSGTSCQCYPHHLTSDDLYSLSEDEDGLSTASTFSSFSSSKSLSLRSPSSTAPSSPFLSSSSSPPRRHRRLALSVPPASADDEDPHSHLFRHFSLSLAVPSPSHRHFLLSSLLSSHPFFTLLPKPTRRRLYDEFARSSHARHQPLLRKGALCDRFSVVEAGEVGVREGGGGGRGYTMGDLCLYHPTVSHATVEVVSERAVVWSVEGSVVRYWMCKDAKARHEELSAFWAGWTMDGCEEGEGDGEGERKAAGREVSEEEMELMLDRCQLVRCEEGDWVVPSSLSRDHVFIVKDGLIATQRKVEPPIRSADTAEERFDDVHSHRAVLGAGSVFAGDNVLFPTIKAALPRQPSPIPFPVPADGSSPAVVQRRKRGRDEPAHPASSALSTIYEIEPDDCSPSDSAEPRKLRRHHTDCVLPSAPVFGRQKSVGDGAGDGAEGREGVMRRSASSPAVMRGLGMGVADATPFAVCAASGCVVAVPVDVLQSDAIMADLKRTLIARMCRH